MIKNIFIRLLAINIILAPAVFAVGGISLDPSAGLISARQLGMGGLSIGFSNDGSGIFSNPAGLTNIEFPQLTGLSRKIMLDETQYSMAGWAMPTAFGTVGLGYVGMNTGGSYPTMLDPGSGRIIINPSLEAISYGSSATYISYAKNIRGNLSVGGNIKLFGQSFNGALSSKASAMGLDLAALYQYNPWLSIGANLQNLIEPTLAWEGGESDKIGGFYKLGCKVNVLGATGEAIKPFNQELNAGLDLDIPHNTMAGSAYHLGLEYFPQEKIALRTGIDQNFGLTFGIGLINGGFRFDYAYAARSGIPGDTPHYFSLSYVGERVMAKSEKLKSKTPAIKFLQPEDKSITDAATIPVTIETKAKIIMDEITTWTVTALSATKEVNELIKSENLTNTSFNGIAAKDGIIESISQLQMGRNVLKAYGYTSPEAGAMQSIIGTGEARVLRYKPFIDMNNNHWAIRPIVLCNTLGLVQGFPDDSFKPDKGITRAELVTLLVRTMPVDIDLLSSTTPFKDVKETHWAAKHIAYGAEKGLIQGYPNGTFAPNKVLNRAEGVTILARYSNLTEEASDTAPFPDLTTDYWANKYIAAAKKAGLLEYLASKDFEPTTQFTRAEACEVLYQTDKIQERVDYFWDTGNLSKELPAQPKILQSPTTETITTSEAQ